MFLGCTDALTAQFISDRTGEASIAVTSKAKQLGTWRISNYTPEYRETSGVGKRKLMTMDEVLRMDIDRALVILRGKKVLEVDKYDYSKHPESKKLRASKAASHIPAWQSEQQKAAQAAAPAPAKPKPPRPKAPAKKAAPAKPPAPPKPEAPPPAPAEAPREPAQEPAPAPPPPRRSAAKPAQKSGPRVVTATKDTILSKPKKEE